MPGMNGLDVLKSIRSTAELQHLHVIVVTGAQSLKELAPAYALGAETYLAKDGSPEEFRQMALHIAGRIRLGA